MNGVNIGSAFLQFEPSIAQLLNDDILLKLGTDADQVLLNRSTILAANTALTSVLIGTPVAAAIAANSLMISNVTASGDIALYVNKGGHSQQVFWADSSAGDTMLGAASGGSVDFYIAGSKLLDYATGAFAFQQAVRISSTSTLTINAFTAGGIISLPSTISGAINANNSSITNLSYGTDTTNYETIGILGGLIRVANGWGIRVGSTTAAHNNVWQAYDVDGAAYANLITLTNNNTPDLTLGAAGCSVTLGIDLTLNAKNLIADTTTGTKIGTGTTEKLGFWNATPVVQQAHIADPTGGATIDAEARTAINSINALCATLGLTAAA